MKHKMNQLQKALKIVCVQRGITYQDVADRLKMDKKEMLNIIKKTTDPKQRRIRKYVHENLMLEITPKVSAILNDMTYKEYCEKHKLNYNEFIYYN